MKQATYLITIVIALVAAVATLAASFAYDPYGVGYTAYGSPINGGYGGLYSGFTGSYYHYGYASPSYGYAGYAGYGNAYGYQQVPPQGYMYVSAPVTAWGSPVAPARATSPLYRGAYSGFTGAYQDTFTGMYVNQYVTPSTPMSIPARYYPNNDIVQAWH